MTDSSFHYGQRVRFKADSLGIIDPEVHTSKFVPEVCQAGDEGEVQTLPGEEAPDGWMFIKPDKYPKGYVPVHPDMIEAVQ